MMQELDDFRAWQIAKGITEEVHRFFGLCGTVSGKLEVHGVSISCYFWW